MATFAPVSAAFLLLVFTSQAWARLECYECTYFELESGTGLVDSFLKAISSQSDEHCRFQTEEDMEEVGRHYCPMPSAGKQSKCAVVKGEVEGEVLLGLVDFKYYTVTRKCTEVDEDEDDGCEEDLPASSSLRTFLTSFFPTAQNMKFKGQACYYSYLTTGADAARISVALLLVAMAIGLLL